MADGAFNAGSAHLAIKPRLSQRFNEELRAQLQKVKVTHDVKVVPNLDGYKAKLTAAVKSINPTVKVGLTPDLTGFQAKLNTAVKGVNAPSVKVALTPDLSGFQQKLDTAVKGVNAPEVKVKLTPDLTGFQSKLNAAVKGVNAPELKVKVIPDLAGFQARLNAAARGVSAPTVKVKAIPDVTGFQQRLNTALSGANGNVKVNVDVDLTAAEAKMLAFRAWAGADLNINVDVDSTAAMLQLNALITQALILQGTLSGLSVPSGLGSGASAASGAMSGLASVAGVAKVALIALAGVSLIPLAGQIMQAAGALALLPSMGAAATASLAAVVIGGWGIKDAFDAAKKASEDAGKDAEKNAKKQAQAAKQVESAQRGVADAQRNVEDAYDDAAQAAKDGARQIVDAERRVQDSQKRSKQAQEDLTRARKDALEQIEDLNLALKGSAIDEEDALIAVERAKERLRDLGKDGEPVTLLDVREAQNNVRGAVQRLDEVRERNKDLRDETIEANKAGVEGSERVVSAKEAVADAVQGEKDAQEDLARTQEDVARQNEQAQRRIEDAHRGVADALDRVAEAQAAQVEAMDASSDSVDKFNEAMAKLSPNAQDFITKVRELGGAWSELRTAVQDSLFAGMGDKIQELATVYIPTLQGGLSNLATVLNDRLKAAMDWLMSSEQVSGIDQILKNTADALGPLLNGLGNLGQILFDLAKVGSDFLPGITGTFEDTTKGWADTIREMSQVNEDGTSNMHTWMQDALDTLDKLWEIIKNIGITLKNLFIGSDEQGSSWLDSMQETTAGWARDSGTPEGKAKIDAFFDDIKSMVDDLASIASGVAKIAAAMGGGDGPTPKFNDDGTVVVNPETGEFEREEDKRGFWQKVTSGLSPFRSNSQMPDEIETGDHRGTLRKREDGLYDGEDGRIYNGSNGKLVDHVTWGSAVAEGSFGDRIADFFFGSGNHEDSRGKLDARIDGSDGRETTWDRFKNWLGFGDDKPEGSGVGGGTPFSGELQSDLQNKLNTGQTEGGSFLGALGDPEVWGEKWTSFSDTVSTGWNEKVWPSLQGVKDKAFEIGEGFVSDVQTKAGNAWTGLKDGVSDGWTSIQGTWETLKTQGLGGLANEFTSKITNGSVTSWKDLPSAIMSGVGDIINTHFPGLGNGLNNLQTWFQNGVDAIGRLWDGLREKLRGPINFVIREVYNNGIWKFWEAIGPKIGLGSLPTISEIPAFATGGTVDGVMSGYSPGVDDRIIAVGGGEAVMRPEWTRAVGPDYVDAANAAARAGGVNGVRQFLGAYADGGTVMSGAQITSGIQQSMWDRIREQFPDIYLTSATRYQDVGSGFDFHMGEQAIDVDGPNKQGYADWIAEAFPNALELFWDPGPNIDNGQPTSAIGGHSDHVHWAMDAPVGEVDPSFLDRVWGGVKKIGGAISSKFRNMAADLFEKPLNALGGLIPDQFDGLGDFGQIPKKLYNTVKDKLVNFVRGKATEKDGAESKGGNTPYDIGAGAEQWRDVVLQALAMTGHDASEADIVLKQIQIESSGNPNVVATDPNDPNVQNGIPSKGLLQTIDTTFQAYRDPSLPDNVFDPLANVVAGIRYADATYGDIKNIWPKTMGYDAGGILPDDAMAFNTSGKPEAVFTHDEWKMLERFADLIGRPDFIDQLAAITGGPAEMPKDPAIMGDKAGNQARNGTYGTGTGTAAAGGYTVPGEGVTAGLESFDKIHGKPGAASNTGTTSGQPVDHLANARNVVTQSLTSYGQKLPGIAKTFLGGWIPEELLNPGGLVGGLLSAGEELFNWYRNQATGGGAGAAASPLGGFDPGSVISGFLGGGTTPAPAPAYQAAPLPAVDQFVRNAPAAAQSGVGSAGDIYNFHVTNIDEAFRKFQNVQSRKAAGFMGR